MAQLTTTDVAARLGVSRFRVWQLIKAGRLPARKFGRDYLIEEADLVKIGPRKVGRPLGYKPPRKTG